MTSLLPKLPCAQCPIETGELTGARAPAVGESTAEDLETIAMQIEQLQSRAFREIAGLLAKAHGIFLYKRDEGGFAGWVKARLNFSRSTAYRLLDIHKNLESVPLWDTFLPLKLLYQLAASGAGAARQEITAQIAAGALVTEAMVIQAVTGCRKSPAPAKPDSADPADPVESDAAASAEARKAAYAAQDLGAEHDDEQDPHGVLGAEHDDEPHGVDVDVHGAAHSAAAAPDGGEHNHHGAAPGVLEETSPAAPAAPDETITTSSAPSTKIITSLAPSTTITPSTTNDAAPGMLEEAPAAQTASDGGEHARHDAAPGMLEETRAAPTKSDKPGDKPKIETLVEHRRRCPAELGALLDDAGLDVVLAAMSPAMNAALGLRARQPANLTLKLRELDNVTAAQTLLDAFSAGRFAAIFAKAHELRAPKGRKAGTVREAAL